MTTGRINQVAAEKDVVRITRPATAERRGLSLVLFFLVELPCLLKGLEL